MFVMETTPLALTVGAVVKAGETLAIEYVTDPWSPAAVGAITSEPPAAVINETG